MAPVLLPDRVLARVRRMAGDAVLCLLSGLILAGSAGAADLNVSAVRFWSLGDTTRIAIEVSGEFHFRTDRIPDPPRIFFDIHDAVNVLQRRGVHVIPVNDKLLKQIRVAQTQLSVTRVVLDLEPEVEVSTSQLSNPDRLIVELRSKRTAARSAMPSPGVTVVTRLEPETPPAPVREVRRFVPPPEEKKAPPPPVLISSLPPQASVSRGLPPESSIPSILLPPFRRQPAPEQPKPQTPAVPREAARLTPNPPPAAANKPLVAEEAPALGARRTSQGGQSMTRVLGLKIGRVVIDAGHGGHDTGTIGPTGLTEKSLVLDVARKLGALIEERMESEVVYTRSDDTFVPLETRTAIANQRHADLFISIHANSSRIRTISGVETYYLNFSTTKEDLDVAARENASAQKSVFELKDLLTRIAKSDKVEESQEFATRVQTSMFALAAKSNPALRNRGVKKAPFVVLIGAEMPSILAEIGFISNPKDEAAMKKSDYRQKVAEALYKGLSQYADGLSHFQVARTGK
jgi:N-acetylmuramoyl-L-alanine amidase